MKKNFLFVSIFVLLYSGCSQKNTIQDSSSISNTQTYERGRIIEQKKVVVAKNKISKIQERNESYSSQKKIDLISLAVGTTIAIANSVTSKNEIEAFEIKIEANNKIYIAYIDYEFEIGTMISFRLNTDNSISNIQSKYLTK